MRKGTMGWFLRAEKGLERAYAGNYTCRLCGLEVFDGSYFCPECRRKLPFNLVYCPRCGRSVAQGGYCLECKREAPPFDKARSLFCYEGLARRLLQSFKEGTPSLAQAFADLALPVVSREFSDSDFIVFVPMTKERERDRGYNQSERLAAEISARSGIPVRDVLEKVRETEQQKRLGRAERQKNLRGAFRLKERAVFAGKRVLLVDDALTTGATAGEICRLLKGAKADRVYLLTVASVGLDGRK